MQTLKEYYRGMRMYLLNKDRLPEDPEAQKAAIHQVCVCACVCVCTHMRMYSSLYKHMYWCLAPLQQISQPLNSLEVLVTQLQQSVDHMYEGVGLLSLASEAATRMGGVRITACDSGVVRSMMSLTLEQTALLARCHALPQKGLRTAMNKFREVGGQGGRGPCLTALHSYSAPWPVVPSRPSGQARHSGKEE